MITESFAKWCSRNRILSTYCTYDQIVGELSSFSRPSRISYDPSSTGRVEISRGNQTSMGFYDKRDKSDYWSTWNFNYFFQFFFFIFWIFFFIKEYIKYMICKKNRLFNLIDRNWNQSSNDKNINWRIHNKNYSC